MAMKAGQLEPKAGERGTECGKTVPHSIVAKSGSAAPERQGASSARISGSGRAPQEALSSAAPGARQRQPQRCFTLVLFSGSRNRHDGIDIQLNSLGLKCEVVDIKLDKERHNLAEDFIFQEIRERVKLGSFDFIFMEPPTSTFALAGGSREGCAPFPLRGPQAPDIYGLPSSSLSQQEKVRTQNAACSAVR